MCQCWWWLQSGWNMGGQHTCTWIGTSTPRNLRHSRLRLVAQRRTATNIRTWMGCSRLALSNSMNGTGRINACWSACWAILSKMGKQKMDIPINANSKHQNLAFGKPTVNISISIKICQKLAVGNYWNKNSQDFTYDIQNSAVGIYWNWHQNGWIQKIQIEFSPFSVPPKLCRKNGVKLCVANSIAEVKLKAEFFIVDADDDMNGGSNDSAASSNCAVVEQMCQSWRFWMDFCQTHDFNASLFTGIPR